MNNRFASLLCGVALAACSSSSVPGAPDAGSAAQPDAAPTDAGPACGAPAAGPATERVVTTSGTVHGAKRGASYAYLNVPFATAARFAAPVAATCAPAELDATQLGAECAQLDGSGAVAGIEDCLQLDLWAPAAAATAPRPVMVFIHGGANVTGSATDPLFDGQKLAEAGDVIVVTVNYRLGQLGFIAHPALAAEGPGSGNFGLLDQIAALRWVQANIAGFGGDAANVTIFGESAGARDVCSLVAAPLAAGLFQRSLMESGSCSALPSRTAAEAVGMQYATATGCTAGDIAACLRALPLATAIQTLAPDPSILVSTAYQPVIDGTIQPVQPIAAIAAGTHNHGAFVVGANADETGKAVPPVPDAATYQQLVQTQFGTLASQVLAQYPVSRFATPRAAYVRVTTDARFVCPSRQIARAALAGQTAATYRYLFAYSPSPLGAVHGLELLYVFGNFSAIVVNGAPYTPTAADRAVSAALQADWTSFARTGVPAGSPAWPVYASADPTREYDATASVVDGIRTADCDFWQQLETP